MSPFAPRKDAPVRGTKDDQPIITGWITTQAAAKVQRLLPALRLKRHAGYLPSSGIDPSQFGGGMRLCWAMKTVRKSLAWSSGGT